MVGAGAFELGVGLPLAAMIIYFVFRDQVSSLVLVLLVVVLAPILGIVMRRSWPMLCMRC
jgi:multisubunit Na+/H+ antiporter MnhG subunit